MNTLFIMLADAPGGGIFGSPIILLVGMFIIMYFFMIRPQMKKQKEAKAFREALSKGDKVVTIGGVHGTILEITETNVLIQVESGKMRVDKSALSATNASSEQDIAQKKG